LVRDELALGWNDSDRHGSRLSKDDAVAVSSVRRYAADRRLPGVLVLAVKRSVSIA
jgi:hypothetical protein